MAERTTERRSGYNWVQDVAVEAVENIGGCASLSDDGTSICILDKGHEPPHGWERSTA